MKTLKLFGCKNLTKFPAFGQLPSLEVLHITKAIKVTHIGFEFYSNSTSLEHVNRVVPFPKLKKLYMFGMDNLEVWELQHGVVMPCVRLIEVDGCPKLKALPALGMLPSLEELIVTRTNEFMHNGCELLYEVDESCGGERFNNTAFPKLDSLTMRSEEWEFGVIAGSGKEIIIMPCLRELEIGGFRNSRPFVEVLSKISSLENLKIWGEATEFIKYTRHDDDDLYIRHDEIILFPNLKELWLSGMEDMEELEIGFQVMPLLKDLTIYKCNKLKAIHHGGSFSKLESLQLLGGCASLYELPPFPNLKILELSDGPIHPSLLPEAFASTTLQALEVLRINCGDNNTCLTCIPEQVQQLTSLKRLELWGCGDELKQRCRKDQGEDWRIISHIPNIRINGNKL